MTPVVTTELIKQLREITGAGISDCKKALQEAEGDLEKARKILMARGLAKAAKKASRATNEGVVKIINDGRRALMFDLQCETDFVARNDKFRELVDKLASAFFEADVRTREEALTLKIEECTAEELIKRYISIIGENIVLGNIYRLDACNSCQLFDYVHFTNKIGVILELQVEPVDLFENDELKALAKDLVLQIAAMRPKYLSADEVPEEFKSEQIELFKQEAIKAGKPEKIAEKIAIGRLNKMYQDIVLMRQPFFKDQNLTIDNLIKNVAKKLGATIKPLRFIRLEI